MSDEKIRQLAEMKKIIEQEVHQLLEMLKAEKIDRKELESGLKRVHEVVIHIPWFLGP